METSINVNRYGNKTGVSTGGQAGNPIQFLPGGIPNPEANRAETSANKESPYSMPAPSVALYKDWNSSINSSSLKPSTPFNLPNIPASTTANAVTGETQATVDQFSRQLAQDQANKQAELSGSKTTLTDLQNQILGVQGSRAQLEQNAGLDKLNTTIADLTNSLEADQKAQNEELKAVNGLGLTDIQKNQKINEINRAYGIKNSDTMFALNQYQRRYDAAIANIDRKIKLQLEPLQTKLQFAQQFYNDNKEAFNKADERAFQNLLTTTNRAYEEARANKTAIGNIQIEALKNGVNIPLSVINQLNTAKTPNEAYSILQANGINLQDPLELAKKKADLALVYANVAKLNADNQVLSIKDAQALGVPYGTTKSQAIAQGKVPGVSTAASELKTNALASVNALLDKIKTGSGTSAIGGTRLFGLQYLPGSAPRDFQVQLDNLKSLLSLDNVKLLKGQGQVSDAERLLLERASGKLDPSQSPKSFKSALEDIQKALSGEVGGQSVSVNGQQYTVGQVYQDGSGAKWTVDANGKWTKQ